MSERERGRERRVQEIEECYTWREGVIQDLKQRYRMGERERERERERDGERDTEGRE